MGERGFDDDDERRIIERDKKVVLSDGREFTHRQIFNDFIKSKFEKPYMREAMYRLLMQTPIKITFSSKEDELSIPIENYFKKKSLDRQKSTPVSFSINGISSDDSNFHKELEKSGTVIVF